MLTHLELCGPYTHVHCLNSPPYLQVAPNTESALASMIFYHKAYISLTLRSSAVNMTEEAFAIVVRHHTEAVLRARQLLKECVVSTRRTLQCSPQLHHLAIVRRAPAPIAPVHQPRGTL